MSDAEIYRKQSFGQSSGWGRNPALLVVDFVNGFNDAEQFGGGNIAPAIERTADLISACRRLGVPIAYTRVVYAADGSDAGVMCLKVPGLEKLTEDNPDTRIAHQLMPEPGDLVVAKQQPSAFFGTGLQGWLTMRGIDTLIHTGCTTSGCVRATVIDGLSHNYRNIVVTDCVGDRALGPHEANLFDMGQKYADLSDCAEVIATLERIKGAASGIGARAAE